MLQGDHTAGLEELSRLAGYAELWYRVVGYREATGLKHGSVTVAVGWEQEEWGRGTSRTEGTASQAAAKAALACRFRMLSNAL